MNSYLHPADINGRAFLAPSLVSGASPKEPTVTSVTITPASAILAGLATQQFVATVVGINSPSQAGTWTKISGVGSLSTSGLYTAPAATSTEQTAVLRFRSTQDNNYYADVTVTIAASVVTPAPTPVVSTVSVSPATRTMAGGSSYQFSAVASGTNNPAQTFNWSIAPAGEVSPSGNVTAPAATSVMQTLTLTATHTVDTNRAGTAIITVPASIVLPNPGEEPDVGINERTVEVTIIAIDQQGIRMGLAAISITLDRVDIDDANGYVAPEQVDIEADASGVAKIRLWPNSRGTLGSQYEVKIVNPDTGKTTRVKAVIPDEDCFLHRVALPPEQ